MKKDIILEISAILEKRKGSLADSSYTKSLFDKGLAEILSKVGEESCETILAAKDAEHSGDNTNVIYETADLWFHTMILLSNASVLKKC